MAMLAEKRKRTKYCLNPNGNLWTNDENKFGQKLLEKMGWEKGQGLGANNQGIIERLKVPFKFDSSGLGFKEKDGLLEQQNSFQDLLKELNNDSTENSNDVGTVIFLEKKSKESKRRVHYKKFTRGKDISRYSSQDLACILGTEKTSKLTTEDSSVSANLIYGGSINNYFEKKKKKNILNDLNVNTDEDQGVASFENGKRKQEHKKIKDVNYQVEDQETGCMTQSEAFCSDDVEKSEKKKKQRCKSELIDNKNQQELEGTSSLHCDTSVTNECFGINNEIREEKTFLENSENNEVHNNRKHKKRKHKPDVAINSEKIEGEHLGDNVDCEVRNITEFSEDIDYKKLKKRKQKKAQKVSVSLNESEVNAEELNNSKNFSIDNNVVLENVSIDNVNTRKKKKKHTQILEQNDYTNDYEGNLKTDPDEDQGVASFENGKRKQEHKKIKDVNYQVEDQETGCMTQSEAFCSDDVEKSEKKKKQRCKSELIDNKNQQELEGTSSLHCDTSVTNECFGGINNEIREEKAFLKNSENNEVHNNKKHKKRKHKPDVAINSEKIEGEHLGDNVDCEVRNIAEFSEDIDYKKLKKRKQNKAQKVSVSLNESEVNAEELNNSKNFSIDNNVVLENVSIDNVNTRKKKKHTQILEQNDNTNNYEGNLKTKRKREKDSKYNLQEDIEKIDSSNEIVSVKKKRKTSSGVKVNGINDEQNLENNTCEIPPYQIDENYSCIKDKSGVKQARNKLRDEKILNADKLLKSKSKQCKNSKHKTNQNKVNKFSSDKLLKSNNKQCKNSKHKTNQNKVNKFSSDKLLKSNNKQCKNSKHKTNQNRMNKFRSSYWNQPKFTKKILNKDFKKYAEPEFKAFSGSSFKRIDGYGYN